MKTKLMTLLILTLAFATASSASCKYQLFNVTANQSVTIADIVQHISNECSYTVVVRDNFAQQAMQKPLYLLNLKDATVDELLDIVLSENDLNYTIDGRVLRVSYLFTETFFVDYIGSDRSGTSSTNITLTSNTDGRDSGNESSSSTNIISGDEFLFWSKLHNEIQTILHRPEDRFRSNRGIDGEELETSILINKEAGLVTVTGTKQQVNRVRNYINKLHDRLKRQVLIDVHILSVSLDESRATGIDWAQIYGLQNFTVASMAMARRNIASYEIADGALGGDMEFEPNTRPRNAGLVDVRQQATVGEVIKFLNNEGDVTSISNPKILTLNNQPALISVGDEFFYKTKTATTTAGDGATTTAEDEQINSVFSGVLLDVTPEISNDGMVTLKINPSLSTTRAPIQSQDNMGRTMPPDLTRRQISSVITLNDGEHVVLGGLITSEDGLETSKVPLLGDIPLLGYAFKRERVTKRSEELVIIITPRIVTGRDAMNLEELGYNKVEW